MRLKTATLLLALACMTAAPTAIAAPVESGDAPDDGDLGCWVSPSTRNSDGFGFDPYTYTFWLVLTGPSARVAYEVQPMCLLDDTEQIPV